MYQLNGRNFCQTVSLLRRVLVSRTCVHESSLGAGCPVVLRGELHWCRHYAKLVSFPLAQTGEGISECELVAWAVKAGDHVDQFDKLCDVQSDKASIEITSRYNGRVVALHHAVGAVVKVGAPLVDLEVADDEQVAPEHLAPEPAGPQQQGQAGTVTSVAVTAAPASPAARPDTPLASSGTAVTTTTAVVSAVRTVSYGNAVTGSVPRSSATVEAAVSSVASTDGPPAVPSLASLAGGSLPVHASPAVRALARELGIDLAVVPGSGPGGRITKADILQYKDSLPGLTGAPKPLQQSTTLDGTAAPEPNLATAAAAAAAAAGASAGGGHEASGRHEARLASVHGRSLAEAAAQYQRLIAAAAGAAPVVASAGAGGAGGEVVPLRGYRRAMVKSMTAAAALPVFHFHDEVPMDRLLAVREALRSDPGLLAQGVRLTVLPLLVKALSTALTAHPHLNASLAPSGTDLVVHPHHNIGVAMATPSGLVVPNVKQVQRKSVTQIAFELALLQQLAAAGKVPSEALAGGTISISNIGTIGGTYATPLVSAPEVAIVALGRLQLLPRYPAATATAAGGAGAGAGATGLGHGAGGGGSGPLPVPVSIMPISWGADHRVVDGAALAAFSNSWKALLEAPEKLLLTLA